MQCKLKATYDTGNKKKITLIENGHKQIWLQKAWTNCNIIVKSKAGRHILLRTTACCVQLPKTGSGNKASLVR